MADRQYVIGGVQPAPADWLLPASLEISPKAAYASFDGSGAASAFYPCLRIISDSGHVVAEAVSTTSVAAGGSADVSWFPHVGSQVSGTSVLPIQPAFSGNTIVPTAIVVGTRATQPSPASFGAGATHVGFRTIITKTGVLHDLAVYIGNSVAGSIEVAILSTDATTRQILYKSGYVVVAGSDRWQVIGDPALPVTVGEQYDVAFLSSAAEPVLWFGGLVNSGSTDAASGQLPTGFVPAPLGAPPKLTWTDTTSNKPYGVQTTVPETSLGPQVGVPLVIGRIV